MSIPETVLKMCEYLQDKNALEDFKKKHSGNFTLTYFKGLGEADPQELGQMIIAPETRLLQKVTVDDVKEADKIIVCLCDEKKKPYVVVEFQGK